LAELPAKDTSTGQIDNQPDGMCLDAAGNLYVAHYGMKQVQVLSPEGKLIARYQGRETSPPAMWLSAVRKWISFSSRGGPGGTKRAAAAYSGWTWA